MAAKKRPSALRKKNHKLVRGVTSREADDGRRGVSGVVASLVASSQGFLRVVIDDVRRGVGHDWAAAGLFTSRDYPAAPLRSLQLDPSELEKLGWLVVARLVAQEKATRRRG